MRISDLSSDVCSSDLSRSRSIQPAPFLTSWGILTFGGVGRQRQCTDDVGHSNGSALPSRSSAERGRFSKYALATIIGFQQGLDRCDMLDPQILRIGKSDHQFHRKAGEIRSEEHTSELQSLMRHSYAVFCLKKKNKNK